MNRTSVFPEQLLLDHSSKSDSKAVASAGRGARDESFIEKSSVADPTDQVSSSSGNKRLIGLILVSLGPALFWTAGVELTARLFGFTATPGMPAGTLLTIFGFLLLACSPCLLRSEATRGSAVVRGDSDWEAPQTSFASLISSSESQETLSAVS